MAQPTQMVRDVMTKRVVTVELDVTLAEIKSVFDQSHFHHLVVVNGNKTAGVISDRDVLKSLSPFVGTISERAVDAHTLQRRAHQIMTRKPITTHPDVTLRQAVELMLQKNVSCLPVVENDHLVGIVTLKDIIKALIK